MKYFKTLRRRGLALFLVLTMCISLLPATAMAAELQTAIHNHNEDGWTCVEDSQLTCALDEHTHVETCHAPGEQTLTCTISESHAHDEACYDETGALTCQIEENHTHGEGCFAAGEAQTVCGKEEHIHGDGCYTSVWTHTPPSEGVTRFLNAANRVSGTIMAENAYSVEEAAAQARSAYDALSPEEQANSAVAGAYMNLTAAETQLAEFLERTIQAFLTAVAAIPEITRENVQEAGEYVNGACYETYEALLGTSAMEREDVQAAEAALMEALQAIETLSGTEAVTLKIDGQESKTIDVGGSFSLTGSGANSRYYHQWMQSGTGYVEFSSDSSRSVTITGVVPGTTTITHRYSFDRDFVNASYERMTVTVKGEPVKTRVFVYVQLDTEGIDTSGWSSNKDGWYTIGYIDVEDLPAPASNLSVSYNQYKTQIDKAFKNLVRHDDNKNKTISLSQIEWNHEPTEVNGINSVYDLKYVSSGATGYSGLGGCWHLDGYLRAIQLNNLTVTYQYHQGEEGSASLHENVEQQLPIGSQFTVDVPVVPGYVAVVTLDDNVVESDALSGQIMSDLAYVVTYHKDANNNRIPDCEETATATVVQASWKYGENSPATTSELTCPDETKYDTVSLHLQGAECG